MSRLIDADKLKEDIAKGDIVIDEEVLKCETIHDMLLYLLKKVDDLMIANIDAQPTVDVPDICVGKWIPVSERLPEMMNVLGTTEENEIKLVWYNPYLKKWFGSPIVHIENVTAWQPLPQPYKESE